MKAYEPGIQVRGVTPYPRPDHVRTASVCVQPTSLLACASALLSPYAGQ